MPSSVLSLEPTIQTSSGSIRRGDTWTFGVAGGAGKQSLLSSENRRCRRMDPPWGCERRLELIAANALHEVRHPVGEERAGDKMREIAVPGHDIVPYCSPLFRGSVHARHGCMTVCRE